MVKNKWKRQGVVKSLQLSILNNGVGCHAGKALFKQGIAPSSKSTNTAQKPPGIFYAVSVRKDLIIRLMYGNMTVAK